MNTIKSRHELDASLNLVASKLAGRIVTVRLINPHGLAGRMYKDMQGNCIIDIMPDSLQDVDTFTELFTHEAAHAKLHFENMPRVNGDIDTRIPESAARAVYAKRYERAEDKKHEHEADTLSRNWTNTVRKWYPSYTITDEPILAVLKILYHKA